MSTENEKLQTLVDMDDKFKAVQDVKTERWTKMLFNGAWNPIAALTGLDTHQLLDKPIYLEMIQRLVEEIYTVAVKSGAVLPADLPARTVRFAQTAAPIIPSMLQDVKHKRTMEIEALCGNIWRQADIVGVPVPAVKATYEALVKMDSSIRMHQAYELKTPEFHV
ncbi:hypothetical protein MMC30_003114 [Trapelia coarctata]|nr:hypothetical protein [Trapelia coarctata]